MFRLLSIPTDRVLHLTRLACKGLLDGKNTVKSDRSTKGPTVIAEFEKRLYKRGNPSQPCPLPIELGSTRG